MKFSIVTPAYNAEQFIAETIESVLSQKGDFEIEYIVMDGGSSDRTADIARVYEQKIRIGSYPIGCKKASMRVISEKDRGMYDAINKGFALASGDIYAWINADDAYFPEAFKVVTTQFETSPNIEWLKGVNVVVDEDGNNAQQGTPLNYRQSWIQKGIYGRYAPFIQQETVFWRRSLWEKAGPIDASLRFAGDYWLWIHFAQYAPLFSIPNKVAIFRRRANSLSNQAGGEKYKAEQAKVIPPQGTILEFAVKCLYWLKNKISWL